MGLDHSPNVVTDGLVFYLDAANTRSYSGSGNTIYNLSLSASIGATKSSGVSLTSNPDKLEFLTDNFLVSDCLLSSGNSFTVSMWFKRVQNFFWTSLFGNEVWNSSTGYVARLESSSTVRFSRGGDGVGIVYSNAALVSSNFNFYTFVKNPSGTNSHIYLNGNIVASGSLENVSVSKPFVLNGRNANDGSSYVDARASQMSSVLVYNRALTEQEVVQNYNATKRRYGL